MIIVIQHVVVELSPVGAGIVDVARPIEQVFDVGGVRIPGTRVLVVGTTLAVVAVMMLAIYHSGQGRALRASAVDPDTAALMGIPVRRYIMIVFLIGSALAGLGGALMIGLFPIDPFVGGRFVIKAFAVALVGGLGNPLGAVLAAVFLGLAEAMGTQYFKPEWSESYAFVLVLIILLLRPQACSPACRDRPHDEPPHATAEAGEGGMTAIRLDQVAPQACRSLAGTTPERVVVLVGAGLFILLIPEFTTSRFLFLASVAGTTAVVACGLAVIFGQAGILSIAHAGLWAIGAYTGAIFHREFGWSYWAVLPLAMIFASFAAALLAYPALRIRGHFFLIATFAFGELVRIVLENGAGFESGRRLGLIVSGGIPDFFGIGLQSANSIYYVTVAYIAIAIFAVWFIRRSSLGFTLRAIRENEDLAESVGIHLARNKILAFT